MASRKSERIYLIKDETSVSAELCYHHVLIISCFAFPVIGGGGLVKEGEISNTAILP